MVEKPVQACAVVDISDEDIYQAMRDVPGYLDITPGDFKDLYLHAYRRAVERLTRAIKARDIMTRDVVSVQDSAPLHVVAQIMATRRVSGIPVVDRERRVVGVISEKDFLTLIAPQGARTFMDLVAECLKGTGCLVVPLQERSAAQVMTAPAIAVSEDTSVMEIAEIFTAKHINRVPVLDSEGRMVGIVSRADIVRSTSL